MARPTTRVIQENDLLNSMGISAIFILQERGEHAGCGDGNEESGFSYSPQQVMDSGIFFYNFGWPDMGICTLEHMLNVVQVMSASLEDGKKIAVHCHAGLGRTGLSIACLLLYKERMQAEEAILLVRKERPGIIKTI
jgi:protein tyrosine phosphatase domain-containing protein 1